MLYHDLYYLRQASMNIETMLHNVTESFKIIAHYCSGSKLHTINAEEFEFEFQIDFLLKSLNEQNENIDHVIDQLMLLSHHNQTSIEILIRNRNENKTPE